METVSNLFQQDAVSVFAVRGGEIERYRELVERHERQVFAVAWSRLGDVSLAEEAAQETFIRGFQRLSQLADGAKFSAWISALARNIATDLGLKQRRELDKRKRWAIEQAPAAGREEPRDPQAEPTAGTLQKTLSSLSTEHRECLVLFYVEGKSGTETSAALGISETAFRMRLHRARKALRVKLDEQLADSLRSLRPANLLVPTVMAGVLAFASGAKAAVAAGTGVAVTQTAASNLLPASQAATTSFFSILTSSTVIMTKSTLTIAAAVLIAAGTAVYYNQKQPYPASQENGEVKDHPRMASGDPGNKTVSTQSSSSRKPSGKSAEAQMREDARRQREESMKGVSNTTRKAIATYQRAKLEGQIQKLIQALSLTDSQKAHLQAWLDDRMSTINTLDLEDEAATSALLKSLTTQALDTEMLKSLTAEQTGALGEFRKSESLKSVNAMALKDLSLIQDSVVFEGDQQDKVYEILTNDAARKLQQQSENPSPEMLMGDIREQKDLFGLGIDQALSADAARNPRGTPDYRKVIDQQIAARVELFRPALNEGQLEQLRNHLKTKTEESYGAFIELMEGALEGE